MQKRQNTLFRERQVIIFVRDPAAARPGQRAGAASLPLRRLPPPGQGRPSRTAPGTTRNRRFSPPRCVQAVGSHGGPGRPAAAPHARRPGALRHHNQPQQPPRKMALPPQGAPPQVGPATRASLPTRPGGDGPTTSPCPRPGGDRPARRRPPPSSPSTTALEGWEGTPWRGGEGRARRRSVRRVRPASSETRYQANVGLSPRCHNRGAPSPRRRGTRRRAGPGPRYHRDYKGGGNAAPPKE